MKWNCNKALRTFLKFQVPNNSSIQAWSDVRVRYWPELRVFQGDPPRPECSSFRTRAPHNVKLTTDP
jgi:hypothetical protein